MGYALRNIRQDIELRAYRRSESIVFRKTKEAFGGLSNMASGYPLNVEGIRISTSEALYQACRFPHLPDVQKAIIGEASPMTAKMRGKPYRPQTRTDWDNIRIKIMRWVLRVKLAQNFEKFSELLLSTGHKPIVEDSHKDDFWGAKTTGEDTLAGTNALGRLLMEVREELRNKNDALLEVIPPQLDDFLIYNKKIGVIGAAPGKPRLTTPQQESFEYSLDIQALSEESHTPHITEPEKDNVISITQVEHIPVNPNPIPRKWGRIDNLFNFIFTLAIKTWDRSRENINATYRFLRDRLR